MGIVNPPAQKGACWTWNQRLIRGPCLILTRGNILLLEIFFVAFHSKASGANIGIIANFAYVAKKSEFLIQSRSFG